ARPNAADVPRARRRHRELLRHCRGELYCAARGRADGPVDCRCIGCWRRERHRNLFRYQRAARGSVLSRDPSIIMNESAAPSMMACAMDDHQLLCAYSEGDERAFETLVEKYFRMVYTVAARQTGDSHLAEEIAQSVFLILSRKARRFSPKTSVPGWLL